MTGHERHHVVRERIYPPSQLAEVMQHLHESRATGTLSIDVREGGIGSVRFTETQKLPSIPNSLDNAATVTADSHT